MKRMKHWAGLFLLSVLLASCAPVPTPAVVARLLNERSQVFWRGGGQPAQEVASGATRGVAVGDEVWTQSQGRALLKFADLWLRLYDDTTLHADDVTPAAVKLALGQGATLVGMAPAAGAGVEITVGDPATARIVLAGTLLMIAQPARGGPTVVRLFAGAARLTALRREQTQVLRAGEWGVVEPDGQIRRPDDDEMRQLARDRGWWDQFSEIERDAAGSGLAEGSVPLVFVACSRPPVLKVAEPRVDGQVVVLDGQTTPGCADDPVSKLTIEWGDGNASAGKLPAHHIYGQPGAYQIVIRAISERGQQAEARRAVTIRSPALPNLVARIVKAPGKATCGQQLGDSVVALVANTGTADAGGFFLGLYLSEDEQITSKDMRLSPPVLDIPTPTLRVTALSSATFVKGLAAGQSLEVGLRGANPIPTSLPEGTRTYWLGIIVDDGATIRESDEGDNASPPWRITIGCLNLK